MVKIKTAWNALSDAHGSVGRCSWNWSEHADSGPHHGRAVYALRSPTEAAFFT
jgi:hypothetical protein